MAKTAEELTQRAMGLIATNRLREALDVFLEICRLSPDDAQAWVVAGGLCGDLGMRDDAKSYLQTAINLEPDHEQAYLSLAFLLDAENDYANALTLCERALAIDSEYPEAWLLHSTILGKLGRHEQAGSSAQRAIELAPELADAHVNLGNSLYALGQHEAAIAQFRHAIQLQPDLAKAHFSLAESLVSLGLFAEAESTCERALSLAPHDPALPRIRARILEQQGRYQDAFDLLRPLVGSEAFDTGAAVVLANASRRLDRSEAAAAILESMLEDENLPTFNRGHIHMALGHLYDVLNDYDKAFEHLEQGHKLSTVRFDPEAHRSIIDHYIDFFSPSRLETLSRSENRSELPIFIVGMPRSGTTLVEQILGSHDNIHGAGELTDIAGIVDALTKEHGGHRYPDCLLAASTETLNGHADAYIQRLRRVSASAQRIVDKMPGNFLYLGLIQQLFPNARVIHCKRDPVDTCLSCYFQTFRGHSYLHDLRHLGMYYLQYERLMQHWRSVLQLPILEVRYEDLVANTGDVSKKLIEFCGLPWDDNCLTFHENKRVVRTASYQQVRRPIYKTSVQRWKHYEAHLQPLLQELGVR